MACGTINGICVAYLRLQPIVTTFATSFVFAGLASAVLSTPGGEIPLRVVNTYQQDPLGISLAVWVAAGVLLLWKVVTSTRYRDYLYSVGGDITSAYESGVPVAMVRISTYVFAGFFSAGSAVVTVLATGTGDPNIGNPYTLPAVVAVVIGGTRLSGGRGGLLGSLLGAVALGFLALLISVSGASTYWQPFILGISTVIALALPGILVRVRQLAMALPLRRRPIPREVTDSA
jgi:ribose transport system permease protein